MLFPVALPSTSTPATWQGQLESPGLQDGLQEWSARGRTRPTFAKLSKEGLCSRKRAQGEYAVLAFHLPEQCQVLCPQLVIWTHSWITILGVTIRMSSTQGHTLWRRRGMRSPDWLTCCPGTLNRKCSEAQRDSQSTEGLLFSSSPSSYSLTGRCRKSLRCSWEVPGSRAGPLPKAKLSWGRAPNFTPEGEIQWTPTRHSITS